MQTMKAEGIEPRFVDVGSGDYIMEAFLIMGMHGHTSMGGIAPLSYGDILSFSQATKRVSEPWEIEALANMSKAYIDGIQHGEKNVKTEPIDTE